MLQHAVGLVFKQINQQVIISLILLLVNGRVSSLFNQEFTMYGIPLPVFGNVWKLHSQHGLILGIMKLAIGFVFNLLNQELTMFGINLVAFGIVWNHLNQRMVINGIYLPVIGFALRLEILLPSKMLGSQILHIVGMHASNQVQGVNLLILG